VDLRGFTNDGSLEMLAKKVSSLEEMNGMAYRAAKKDKKRNYEKMWPTPSANKITESGEIVNADGTLWDGKQKPHSKTTGKPIQTALTDAVKLWPIPTANDHKGSGPTVIRKDGKDRSWDRLDYATEQVTNPNGGSLNPEWVEWLQGFPVGWTDLKD